MLEPSTLTVIMLFLTGILAGVCNAIAGGGTFFTFPAFLATGLPPVIANASNALAVWPGHALAIVDYRKELANPAVLNPLSVLVALIGAVCGALLLMHTTNATFVLLIPFLLLLATAVFAWGNAINGIVQLRLGNGERNSSALLRAFEFIFAAYGGFFGAGLGVMLMAGLSIFGVRDIHIANAIKNLLATVITTVSVAVLWTYELVSLEHALPAFVGAIIGGLAGGRIARKIPAGLLRKLVITMGIVLSIFYFMQYYT